ncbi:MAG: alpha-amylase family glycosyl hydrolase [Sphaerochaetaceae bacterium]|jgi:glycosidase|nr:alpha-amylase family glycosyl hydrolase [Sphaerochaetaceae bacterium]MDD4841225.1 alpha-amylase family glycosyl hydrolase [Sphaerochaetaceae bacterium]NLO60203.1 alpha-amylase [Spirochaetales bacterium]
MGSRDLRIAARTRIEIDYHTPVFPAPVSVETMLSQSKEIAYAFNQLQHKKGLESFISAGKLNAVGVLHTIYQAVISRYLVEQNHDFFTRLSPQIARIPACQDVLIFYAKEFPSPILMSENPNIPYFMEETIRGFFIHQIMIDNPAILKSIRPFINPQGTQFPPASQALTALMGGYTKSSPRFGENEDDLYTFLTEPSRLYSDSLNDQISFILEHWKELLPEDLLLLLLRAIDVMNEEEKPRMNGGPGPIAVPDYSNKSFTASFDKEAFTADRNWMPNVVLIAKSTLVWLDQLSKTYGYPIKTLDAIPDRELDLLAQRGFTGLWLIGLWERSQASKSIKIACGNPDAEASAYSLKSYDIASNLGGWEAYKNLDRRCTERNIRLASDMVPNHTGLDSDWMIHHPEFFISSPWPPYPNYSYNGIDLSDNPNIEIKIEDHYYDRSDAAVTFRRIDKRTHETMYIFHGNDGTTMPWNDTAQLDFLNKDTREAVIQQILHVASNFSIIRFDAAMTLARKHVQRLWYPRPGSGGDIPGRSTSGLTEEEFNQRMPQEFWREVVDRIATELPDTLLLAEAFWMMEGYFVRTLGMHRVYNSAFMNMLKNQENKKYRDTIKNTIAFDPEILKRFVNFMNNPDEDTAIAQFGDGDRYFGVCTLLATMPGLPMFGHGQIEGFKEKYGMEFKKAYWEETPDNRLISEHERRIFPLLRMRYLFSGSENFELFDMANDFGVEEAVFAYVNGIDTDKVLVVYNNRYEKSEGRIKTSAPKLRRKPDGSREVSSNTLAESLDIKVGGRRFVLYMDFYSNRRYLCPSITFFDEGLFLHLNGYETRIFTDIREVEDFDGAYEKLYQMIGNEGSLSFERDLKIIRMEPIFKAMENFRSPEMFKMATEISHGTSSPAAARKFILMVGESYARLTAEMEKMPSATQRAICDGIYEVDPLVIVGQLKRLTDCFKEKKDEREQLRNIFHTGAIAMAEIPLIINAYLFIKPFLPDDCSLQMASTIIDQLATSVFFKEAALPLTIGELEIQKVLDGSAFLASCPQFLMHLDRDCTAQAKKLLAKLMDLERFRTYIGYNLYDGIVWYRKESFQQAVFLLTLGVCVNEENESNSEHMIRLALEWLRLDSLADYRIQNLLG